ncbi:MULTISPECIES: PQQ-dependent sugar dehydrogenase [Flavobacteriaceae]|uniref:PQQ-dependent sugar dehydrogenase n=1 Tax=Flavobacteriaceae TaxID=49546 RepID=UPI00234B1960|nr:PQQ-dependent sugar dehydrogenase [Muricauda sp. SP22]MDC6363717.1 PQQ-dependent sugar dehydrogenase [Muricauda sp. SP22]
MSTQMQPIPAKDNSVYPWMTFVLLIGIIFASGCKSEKEPKWNGDIIQGKALFNQYCASCHDLRMNGMGPKLGGITAVVEKDWLLQFVQNPEKLIKDKDERATKLFDEYKSYMPSFSFLPQEEVESILTYIHKTSDSLGLTFDSSEAEISKSEDSSQRTEPDLSTIPKVQHSNLSIVLEDFMKMPKTGENPPSRLASMRSVPLQNGESLLFVHDQRGSIYQLQNGKATVFLNLKDRTDNFIDGPGLASGLGTFTFHPEYLKNGKIYTIHTEKPQGVTPDFPLGEGMEVAMQWILTEWVNSNPTQPIFQGSRKELLRIDVPTRLHGMQDIIFSNVTDQNDPDYGMLYLGIGDGGATIAGYPELCHSIHSPLGTILRIDPKGNNSRNGKYGIPMDNPYANSKDGGVWKEIYAYGFRNPHRITWIGKGENARLIAADVGELTVEEINMVKPGSDYGWNEREGYFGINPKKIKELYTLTQSDMRYELPYALFGHETGNAISGGYVYEGPIKELNNHYIFGDIVQGKVFSLNVFSTEPQPIPIKELGVFYNGKHTHFKKIVGNSRTDLRIGKDGKGNFYTMNKADGTIRKITGVVPHKTP